MEGYMCERSKHGKAVSTVLIENERTCVTEWRFKKYGDNTGWHRHEYDYIVVPLFDGQLENNLGTSKNTSAPMKNGVPYFEKQSRVIVVSSLFIILFFFCVLQKRYPVSKKF